jgi:hypothetical protein
MSDAHEHAKMAFETKIAKQNRYLKKSLYFVVEITGANIRIDRVAGGTPPPRGGKSTRSRCMAYNNTRTKKSAPGKQYRCFKRNIFFLSATKLVEPNHHIKNGCT